jgi:hypothetical protein
VNQPSLEEFAEEWRADLKEDSILLEKRGRRKIPMMAYPTGLTFCAERILQETAEGAEKN